MKKILLIIVLALCIFQMVVLATAIEAGSPAVDGSNSFGSGYTVVDRTNPVTGTGTMTSIAIYASNEMSNVDVGTFYVVSGSNLSTRAAYVTITTVSAGYHEYAISLAVTVGDYLGISDGDVDYSAETNGSWYKSGDHIPCTDQFFSSSNYKLSFKATGATPETGNAIFFGFNF